MTRPRLLDLFCGAVALLNKLCYNKVCLSNVLTVAKIPRLNGKLRGFVRPVVSKDLDWDYLKRGIAYCAVKLSHWEGVTIIGDIALITALRRRLLSIPYSGMRHIRTLWLATIRTALSRILGCGETSITLSVLNLSEYWGVNV